jgi:hypothetical protein
MACTQITNLHPYESTASGMPNKSFSQYNSVLSIFIMTTVISILVNQNGDKINKNLKLQNTVPLQLMNMGMYNSICITSLQSPKKLAKFFWESGMVIKLLFLQHCYLTWNDHYFINVGFGWTLQPQSLSSNILVLTILWHKFNAAVGAEKIGTCQKVKSVIPCRSSLSFYYQPTKSQNVSSLFLFL